MVLRQCKNWKDKGMKSGEGVTYFGVTRVSWSGVLDEEIVSAGIMVPWCMEKLGESHPVNH